MYEVCSIVFCKDSAFLRNKKFAPVFSYSDKGKLS